jgi:hypothetical protein
VSDIPPLPSDAVAALATLGDEGPAVIPVSAIHRAGPHRVLFALAPGRGSLARIRADGRVALLVMAAGVAVTVRGDATVVADPLPGADFVVALALEAREVTDTLGDRTLLHGGVRWGWRDPLSARRHREVLAALATLAAAGPSAA